MDTANLLRKREKKRIARRLRVRAKIIGTPDRPRLTLARTNRYLYAQLIDDQTGRTLVSASSREPQLKIQGSGKTVEVARLLGKVLAERARARGIEQAVFDRGWHKFHGRIRAFVEGAREAGLKI